MLTESRNKDTEDIDKKPVEDIVRIINNEDKKVASAVEWEYSNIAKGIELIIETINSSGKLYFIGAGTSGRLGIMQAAECPPTYGTNPELIQGLMSGGREAFYRSIEGAEDDLEAGYKIIEERLTENDILVALSASGSTSYVIGALRKAYELRCKTIAISCNPSSKISELSDVAITLEVGPEVITGSTRMKAATAQKMVLDILTTTAMIKLGYVDGNLMTHLQPKSEKLRKRQIKNFHIKTGVDYETAENILKKANYNFDEALRCLEDS